MFFVVMVAFDVTIVKNLVNCCQLKIQKGVLLLLNSVKVKLSVHHGLGECHRIRQINGI